MDRYIVREPRVGAECLQGNQIIAYPTNTAGNNMIPETYYGPYGSEFQNVRVDRYPSLPQHYAQANMMHGQQVPMMSGIDPTYLAAYSNNNTQFIAGHQQMQREVQMERQMQFRPDPPFGSDYQNRNLMPVDRSNCKYTTQVSNEIRYKPDIPKSPRLYEAPAQRTMFQSKTKPRFMNQTPAMQRIANSTPVSKQNKIEIQKIDPQPQVLTRIDKLKALQKSGPRAFSGPVEKVLKWHKALQEIEVLIIFEIVAKCVSIRSGDGCSKILVVRDDNGPATQVVYYEIDFLLPELKPPCTVRVQSIQYSPLHMQFHALGDSSITIELQDRVVGRMMPGTCRLQAFNVRPATGDDVATLPRRAAVASHHVTKLCKEFGTNVEKN